MSKERTYSLNWTKRQNANKSLPWTTTFLKTNSMSIISEHYKIFVWLYSPEHLLLWQKSCSATLGVNTLSWAGFISPCVRHVTSSISSGSLDSFKDTGEKQVCSRYNWSHTGAIVWTSRQKLHPRNESVRKSSWAAQMHAPIWQGVKVRWGKIPYHSIFSLSLVHTWSHNIQKKLPDRSEMTILTTIFEHWVSSDGFLYSTNS